MVSMSNYTEVPVFELNDGREMPAVGFGTYKLTGDQAVSATRSAIDAGYRHIDTAVLYGNEAEVGAAVKEAITAGDTTREELFINTKVWHDHHEKAKTIDSVKQSLSAMGLDYLDSVMVHWPWPQGGKFLECYEGLLTLREQGLIKSVAVANFYPEVLKELIDATGVAPVLNQVELHPGFSQKQLRDFHAEHGIITEAWMPIARGKLVDEPAIVEIAEAAGKSVSQIALRWEYQLGVSVVPKSGNPQRQAENIDIFDFELSEDQMSAITALDQTGGRLSGDPLTFPGEG
ncbi:aldo/keto reductase [Corynebacterium sp. ZY180755]